MKGWIMLLQETGLPAIRWHDLRSIYCTLLLKNNFSPKAVAKLMGDARELITMDVYGDNGNIIAEEIPPELLSYIEEVLAEKKKDNIENVLDTLINVEKNYRTNVRFAYTIPYFHDIMMFKRRAVLDFSALPVFFVSNLLLVQRKKYYFNRAMVSRNCSIVL